MLKATITSAHYWKGCTPGSTLVSYKINVYHSNLAESKLILDIPHCYMMYWQPMVDESSLEVEELHNFTVQNT